MKRILAGIAILAVLASAKVKRVEEPVRPPVEQVFQSVNAEEGWSLTIYRYKGANIIVKEELTDDGSLFATMVAPSKASASANSALAKGLAIIDRGGVR